MSKKIFIESQIEILSKNKYVKKVRDVRKGCENLKIKLLTQEKYLIIKSVIDKYKLKNMIRNYMCFSSRAISNFYQKRYIRQSFARLRHIPKYLLLFLYFFRIKYTEFLTDSFKI